MFTRAKKILDALNKTADKASISITGGKSTTVGLNETERNKMLLNGKL